MLASYLKRHPDLNVEEQLYLATSTQADNEYAIEKSRREELKGKQPSPEEYLKIANTWATGSNLAVLIPVITSNQTALTNIAPLWNDAENKAQSTSYPTNSHSDSGPREYQLAEAAERYSQNIDDSASRIIDGIEFTKQNAPVLDAKIKKFIEAAFFGKNDEANRLRHEVLQLARDIYQKNFEGGFDVQPFKWTDVILFALLGMATGGLAGAGVEHLFQMRRRAGTLSSYSP